VPPASLTVVGTGYLIAGQTTPESLAAIGSADKLLYLVADPATRLWLDGLNPTAESLYDAYAEGRPRRDSYREMVERILAPVRRGLAVCAAFYGHPGVFVQPSHEAIRRAREEGYPARMLPGVSAEDCLFADLGVDPARDGCQSFEASDFLVRRRRFDPTSALVLWQVGAIGVSTFLPRAVWSDRGLPVLVEVLGEHYPAAHEVVLYTASGLPVCEPAIERLPLADLARARVPITATLYVPPRERAPIDPEMASRLGLRLPAQ
jgi:uncharacterized protein YabN with tetrapyrrole methylase and pyrophosphatase domain